MECSEIQVPSTHVSSIGSSPFSTATRMVFSVRERMSPFTDLPSACLMVMLTASDVIIVAVSKTIMRHQRVPFQSLSYSDPTRTLWSSGYTIVLSFVDEFGSAKGSWEFESWTMLRYWQVSDAT